MLSIKLDKEKTGINFTLIFLALYLLVSPFDMVTNFGIGTITRYMGFLFIISFALSVFLNNKRIFLSKEFFLFFLWILFGAITSLWSDHKMVTFVTFLWYSNYLLLFLLINSIKFSFQDICFVKNAVIIGGLLSASYALMLMDFESSRLTLMIDGTTTDANNLAASWLMPLIFSLDNGLSAAKRKKVIQSIFYFATILVILYGILLTGSRTAILALIVGVLLPLILKGKIKIRWKSLLILLIILTGIYMYNKMPDQIMDRMTFSAVQEDQGSERLIIWNMALEPIKENFVFGSGLGTFPYVMETYYGVFVGAHNIFIEILSDLGIIGLVIFVAFLLMIFKRVKKKSDWTLIATLLSMIIFSFFLGALNKKFFWNSIYFTVMNDDEKK